jgi:hypothetical protein
MRMRVLSGLLVSGLWALPATGQGNPAPRTNEVKTVSLEDDIARAVRTHPDVQVAEAEAKLANAKLEQAKLAVAQRVAATKREKEKAVAVLAATKSRLELVNHALESSKARLDRIQQLAKNGAVPLTEVRAAEAEYENAKLAVLTAEQAMVTEKMKLAEAEAAYDALVGRSTTAAAKAATSSLLLSLYESQWERSNAAALLLEYQKTKTVQLTGTIADQLRQSLDKPVKISAMKGADLDTAFSAVLKAAGVNGIVRVPTAEQPKVRRNALVIDVAAGEFTLGSWLQLLTDQTNDALQIIDRDPTIRRAARYDLYVREYGLLVADPELAPKDAPTLDDFWRRHREITEKPKADQQPKK